MFSSKRKNESNINSIMTELTGKLVFVGDPKYEAARQNLIKLYQSYPYVIVFAKNVCDVRNAIKWSRENNVTLRIRGGRNSTEGWCSIDNGIVLDVSRLKDIDIDTKNRMVRVGAGVTQGELTDALSNTGFYSALGDEGILGMIGVLLGGGIGLLSRHKGPGCDSLLQTEMVLADSSIVTTDLNENSDLFWMNRGGGGGNVGVVTSFAMQLYVAPKFVVVWECVFPLSGSAGSAGSAGFDDFFTVYNTWQRWAPKVKDTRLSSKVEVFNNRVDIKGIFLGSEAELGDLLEPIEEAAKATGGTCIQEQKPFSEWFVSKPSVEQPFQKYSPMWVFKLFPRSALQSIYNHALTAPSDQSSFFSLAWGGSTREVPPGGTAFPRKHRKAIFYAEPGAQWADAKINAQAFTWVESLRFELSPFFSGGYVNVLDRSIAQYGKEYYGRKHFARLQRIKAERDPNNVFHFEQSIPVCNTDKKDEEKVEVK